MPDRKTENEKAKGKRKLGALKLTRETLRELDAGELEQAQGGPGATHTCFTYWGKCTRRCDQNSKKC